MHAHLGESAFDQRAVLSLYVANGVTGIRIMNGLPAHHLWRMQVLRGQIVGPEMVIASRIIGLDHWVGRAHEAEQLVIQAKREGADFIKVHDSISREAYFALMSEAKRLELPVEGHVPLSISAGEASNIGQRSIEHFTGLDGAAQDSMLARSLLDTLAANRTWVCPTLIMRHNYARLQDASLLRDPRLAYLPSSSTHWWLDLVRGSPKVPLTEWEGRKRLVRMEDGLVGKMEKAGISLLAGTDNGNPFCYPGFSIPEELELLVQAGLSPWEALQAATVNPTHLLENSDSLGEIARGKIADLVLLNANPIDDIRNIRKVSAVVFRGQLFDRQSLDGLLARARSLAKPSAHPIH
jgi:imidazolonepropionase-like amidohydrolase